MAVIDRLVVAYGTRLHAVTNADYRPEQAIEHRTLINEHGKRLYVVFPHWHAGQGLTYKTLIKNLAKDDSAVMAYGLNDYILQPNIEIVLASFEHIKKQVAKDLQELTSKNKYQEIVLVGISLGNVSLAKVAETFPDFKRVIMAVSGSNLARCTWEGIRTQAIRQAFERQGVTEDTLDAAWQTIAPKYAAESFRGKKVSLLVSSVDHIIPTNYQYEMVDVVSGVTDDIKVKYTKTGHATTIFRFCSKGSV